MVGGGVRDGDEEAAQALWPRPITLGEDYSRRRRAREHDRRRAAALREKESNERLARECLDHYNALHPGDEHDLAPGDVTLSSAPCNSTAWTHGNFVAARRRSGYLASLFLPSRPRTLFFFEHMSSKDFLGVVTCVPLAHEPVGDGLLAEVPLCHRWATQRRRSGRRDCVCKTCHRGLHVKHPWLKKKVVGEFPCGHLEAESVCKMCFSYSDVVHPSPGKFARGYQEHEDDFWRPCNGCKM